MILALQIVQIWMLFKLFKNLKFQRNSDKKRTEKGIYNDLYNFQYKIHTAIKLNFKELTQSSLINNQPLYILYQKMGQCVAQKSDSKIEVYQQPTNKVLKTSQLQSNNKITQNQIYRQQGNSSNQQKKQIEIKIQQLKEKELFKQDQCLVAHQNCQNIDKKIYQNKCNDINQLKGSIYKPQSDNNLAKNISEVSSMNQGSKLFTPKKWQKVKKKQSQKKFKENNSALSNLISKESKCILSQKQIEAEKRIKNILDLNTDISRKYGIINKKLNERAQNIIK